MNAKKKAGYNRDGEKGFSLIELLIVMVIIGLLAGLVGPKMFGKVDTSKQKTAKTQISLLETALDMYRLDMGSYPTTEMGIRVLREKPDSSNKWDGPYLPKEIPVDPWGNPYHYASPSDHGAYEIISYGADGVEGGDDINADITNWKDLETQ
jgi:general secretion pathway protein G